MKMVTVSDQINFYPKTVMGDKARHNIIIIKVSIQQEHVTVININIYIYTHPTLEHLNT